MNSNKNLFSSSLPPFFWTKDKVPVSEKDYMFENSKRIRQIAQQQKQMRGKGEPLKANFIPGLTKNNKYAHIPSKIGQILKDNAQKSRENLAIKEQLKFQNEKNQNGGGNKKATGGLPLSRERFSRSANDLAGNTNSNTTTLKGGKSIMSANFGNKIANQPRHRPFRNPPLLPQNESVYNWRFSDDIDSKYRSTMSLNDQNPMSNHNHHRIEYLPCDGICAEETYCTTTDSKEDGNESGRSFKTSRGINTDETRIFIDRQIPTINSQYEEFYPVAEEEEEDKLLKPEINKVTKSIGKFTLRNVERESEIKNGSSQLNHIENNSGEGKYNMSKINSGFKDVQSQSEVNFANRSSTTNEYKSIVKNTDISTSHNPGDIPKYLLKRKEEWKKVDEEKKAAEQNALAPAGHRQMSEEERQETLIHLKKNYDDLINELNRIPIRIDTIRVREQKIRLEQQLTKLEEAMKTFSRPNVFIRVNNL